ncbi:MAG: SAM-dependent methyltransferase [Candidatus Symbiothrix sp.]|jgi:16S rRNA (cytidine1402-2'-O)-methyltransferase|nr:SAM-dependent methyltransferase [Candidatus Symbiothrix sp.]
MAASLFLLPVTLGETALSKVLPPYNKEVIVSLKYFIVENVRTARRFLKQTDPGMNIDELTFFTLNKYTTKEELSGFLDPVNEGHSIGIISEAGCPAIADPGADVVAMAQQKGIQVVPLVGPSSILLALMASGFNGQNFAFLGYLPIDNEQRIKTLKLLEQRISSEKQTQLFIETPYRNNKLLEDILKTCKPSTQLCIAADITLETEYIKTKSIGEWKKKTPDLSKRPCIFAMNNSIH